MNEKKEKLKKAILTSIPATEAHAVCSSPTVTKEASVSLEDLKKVPIQSEQWPQFVVKLDEKIHELEALYTKELEACEKVKDEVLFIGEFKRPLSPFCQTPGCFNNILSSEKKVIELENKASDSRDRFIASLLGGARAQAEMYAASEKDPGMQIYFYTLLRLASEDVWNAYILLESLQKKKGWENYALYLKYLIAEKNGRERLAQKWDVKDKIVFTEWEEELFESKR